MRSPIVSFRRRHRLGKYQSTLMLIIDAHGELDKRLSKLLASRDKSARIRDSGCHLFGRRPPNYSRQSPDIRSLPMRDSIEFIWLSMNRFVSCSV